MEISPLRGKNEKLLIQANHYITNLEAKELRAKPLPAGTVVFAKIGAAIALNRRAILGQPSLVDNNVMGLFAGDEIDGRFLFHFVCTLKLDELARAKPSDLSAKAMSKALALNFHLLPSKNALSPKSSGGYQ